VLDAVSAGLAVLAPDGTVEYANATAERALGDAARENVLVGPGETLGGGAAALETFAEQLRAVATGEREEIRFETAIGDDRHFERRMSRLSGSTPSGWSSSSGR